MGFGKRWRYSKICTMYPCNKIERTKGSKISSLITIKWNQIIKRKVKKSKWKARAHSFVMCLNDVLWEGETTKCNLYCNFIVGFVLNAWCRCNWLSLASFSLKPSSNWLQKNYIHHTHTLLGALLHTMTAHSINSGSFQKVREVDVGVHCTLYIVFCLAMQFIILRMCSLLKTDFRSAFFLPYYNWHHELILFTSNKRYRMYFIYFAYCIYVWGRSLSLTGKYFDIVNNDFTSICYFISFHFKRHCQWWQN